MAVFFLSLLSPQISSHARENGPERKAPIKGVFGLPVDHAILKGKSYDEIARYLMDLKVNTVIGSPLDEKLILALHGRGIRVYAEVGIFSGQAYWERHPESRPINSKGEPIAQQDWYCGLCPTQAWLIREKLDTIRRIVRDFDVDGIWLDFIRYPCHWEVASPVLEETCFCSHCLEKFQADTGIRMPPDLKTVKEKAAFILGSHSPEWYAWRCDQITYFVKEAKEALAEKNGALTLGIFTVPWREGELRNAIITVIAQDFKKLSSSVDVFAPMTYHKMCHKDIRWIGQISGYMQETGKKVIPLVQAMDVSKEELAEALAGTLSHNKAGLVVFEMNAVLNDKKEETLRKAFE